MSFVTGLLLIDAPASALNNLGSIPGARTDNTVGVKMIKTRDGAYPYVSAQAFRYWLRATLEDAGAECGDSLVYAGDWSAASGADSGESNAASDQPGSPAARACATFAAARTR